MSTNSHQTHDPNAPNYRDPATPNLPYQTHDPDGANYRAPQPPLPPPQKKPAGTRVKASLFRPRRPPEVS